MVAFLSKRKKTQSHSQWHIGYDTGVSSDFSIESVCINHLMDSIWCQIEIQFNETYIMCEQSGEIRGFSSTKTNLNRCARLSIALYHKLYIPWFNFNYHCIRAISIWIVGLLDFRPKSNFQLDLRLHRPQYLQSDGRKCFLIETGQSLRQSNIIAFSEFNLFPLILYIYI